MDEQVRENPFLILMVIVGAVTLVTLGLQIRVVRRALWTMVAIFPAGFLAFLGILGAPIWLPLSLLARAVVRTLRLGDAFDAFLSAVGRPSKDPLLLGKREEAARRKWPEAVFPYLYREVPEDLERPLWEDGKLVGGYGLETLAERHMTRAATRSALQVGLTAGLAAVIVPLLAAFIGSLWSIGQSVLVIMFQPLAIEGWPGAEVAAVPIGWWLSAFGEIASLAAASLVEFARGAKWGLAIFGPGTAILTFFVVLNAWRRQQAAPYEFVTKDADVRWTYRAESRQVVNETYNQQIRLATTYLQDEPTYLLGHATGTLRARGDLAAPAPGQRVCIDGESLFQHTLIFGGTGEGKTTAFLKPLVRQLLRQGVGLYVCDAKGVLWEDVRKLAEAEGRADDVLVVGTDSEMAGVDLLSGLSPTVVAATLRSVMRQMNGQEADSFWPDMASNMLRHVLTVAQIYRLTSVGQAYRSKESVDPYSLWWAYCAVIQGDMLESALEACLEQLENDPLSLATDSPLAEFKASAEYLIGTWRTMAGETKTGIIANVTQLLDGFAGHTALREKFASGASASTISTRAALDGKIVLNALSSIEGGMPARLTSIMLKTILYRDARLRENELGSKQCQAQPCIMIADEVQEIVTADPASGLSDGTFWNVARSAGLGGIFATQTVAAITQALGEDIAKNFMQQARSKIFLRSEDRDTVEYACWIAGKQERVRVYEDGHRESIEQRLLLDGWTPIDPVDEEAEVPSNWRTLLSAAFALLLPGTAALGRAARRSTHGRDNRFVNHTFRSGYRAPDIESDGRLDEEIFFSDESNRGFLQDTVWRAEDKNLQYRTQGNEDKAALTANDVMGMGRWHAFVHVQRAGAARQDVIEIRHDFD